MGPLAAPTVKPGDLSAHEHAIAHGHAIAHEHTIAHEHDIAHEALRAVGSESHTNCDGSLVMRST